MGGHNPLHRKITSQPPRGSRFSDTTWGVVAMRQLFERWRRSSWRLRVLDGELVVGLCAVLFVAIALACSLRMISAPGSAPPAARVLIPVGLQLGALSFASTQWARRALRGSGLVSGFLVALIVADVGRLEIHESRSQLADVTIVGGAAGGLRPGDSTAARPVSPSDCFGNGDVGAPRDSTAGLVAVD